MEEGKRRGGLGQKKIGTGRHASVFPKNIRSIPYTNCTGSHGKKDSNIFKVNADTILCTFLQQSNFGARKRGEIRVLFFTHFPAPKNHKRKTHKKRHCTQKRKSSRLTLFSLAYLGKNIQNQMWETDCSYIKEGTCVTTFRAL